MNITQKITLDLTKRSVFQYVSAKQGDNSSRLVEIALTNNGVPYAPPEGVGAKFRAQKPDGTMILNPAVVNSGGSVTVELTQQTLAVSGDVIADVYLTDSADAILSSVSFVIHVDPAPMGTMSDSDNEFLVLTRLVDRAEDAARTATQKVEEAGKSATQAGQSANTAEGNATAAAESARQAGVSKDKAVQSATDAKKSAETASTAAATAGQNSSAADKSAQAAQQSAKQAETAMTGVTEAEIRARQSAETATQKAADASKSAERAEQAASAAADKLPLAGGTMQGPINMGGQGLIGLKDPVNDSDAVPLGFAKEHYAPSEFGLGKDKGKPIDDCNEARLNGFYYLNPGCKNTPSYAELSDAAMVCYRENNVLVQEVRKNSYLARRHSTDGGIGYSGWEYDNPPMELGKEYRTTERWNGSPVFVKNVDAGFLPNNSEKTVEFGISNISHIVDISYIIKKGIDYRSFHPKIELFTDGSGGWVWGGIRTTEDLTQWKCWVKLKYTKS